MLEDIYVSGSPSCLGLGAHHISPQIPALLRAVPAGPAPLTGLGPALCGPAKSARLLVNVLLEPVANRLKDSDEVIADAFPASACSSPRATSPAAWTSPS
jgi:hypothetical protein